MERDSKIDPASIYAKKGLDGKRLIISRRPAEALASVRSHLLSDSAETEVTSVECLEVSNSRKFR